MYLFYLVSVKIFLITCSHRDEIEVIFKIPGYVSISAGICVHESRRRSAGANLPWPFVEWRSNHY